MTTALGTTCAYWEKAPADEPQDVFTPRQRRDTAGAGNKPSTREVDQALIERVQGGDRSAFDLLVRKYQGKVMKVVARYVRDTDEVADVTQEAFIKAYRAIDRFRGDSAFFTWMYRIAANTAMNHVVAAGRRPPDDDLEAREAEQYEGVSALKEFDSPEHLVLRDEIEQSIAQAVEELPEDLATAITLRELKGLSYEAIARAMGCPVGTVRSRIFRAREAIDNRLRPLLY